MRNLSVNQCCQSCRGVQEPECRSRLRPES